MITLPLIVEGKIREDHIAHMKFLIHVVHDGIPTIPEKPTALLNWLRSTNKMFEYFHEVLREAFNERPDFEHAITRRFLMERNRLKTISDHQIKLGLTLGGTA